jgi:hypothetical protein
MGSLGKKYRFKKKVVNISRNPYVFLMNFNDEVINHISDELTDLYKRKISKDTVIFDKEEMTGSEFLKVISSLAYPGVGFFPQLEEVPLFAANLLRNSDLQKIASALFAYDTKNQQLFINNIDKVTEEKLGFLLASRNIVKNDLRIKHILQVKENISDFVDQNMTDTINEIVAPEFSTSFFRNNLSYNDLLIVRRIAKKVDESRRINFLSSKVRTFRHLEIMDSLEKWNRLENTKNIIDFTQINSIYEAHQIIDKYKQQEAISDNNNILLDKIKLELENLFNIKFTNSRYQSFVIVNTVEMHYRISLAEDDRLNKNPNKKNVKNAKRLDNDFGVSYISMHKASTMVELLKTNPYAPKTLASLMNTSSESFMLNNDAFYQLILDVKAYAHTVLKKKKIELSDENVRLIVSLVFLLASGTESNMPQYKGVIPSKVYTMIKNGLDEERIYFMLKHNVPVKAAVLLKDVPSEMVFDALGIDNNRNNINF